MYNYDHDCPFEAFVTNLGKYNEGNLVGEWVSFPTTQEELEKVFERIGIGSTNEYGDTYEEWFITDYDCYVDGIYEMLSEHENLDELNYFASKLEELNDYGMDRFQAIMQESDFTSSVKDLINLIDNMDKYDIYPGVEDNTDLGHYCIEELGMLDIPEPLQNYFDYEAYGRDVAFNYGGTFTDAGFVVDRQESFIEYYDGVYENIPEEYRITGKITDKEKETNMDYESFKQEFSEDLKQKLEDRGFEDVNISFHDVEKMNQSYEAITVTQGGSNIGVNFNIETAFSDFQHTGDYAGVLAESTFAIANSLENIPVVDVAELTNYEAMKDKLSIEVVSAERNEELLSKVPHENVEDMAVVYRFVLESNDNGRSSILVTNDMLEHMGVTQEQLKADALENAPEIRPAVIQGMNEVMMEMMGPDAFEMFGMDEMPEEMMYVASVPDKQAGAGVLAYQDFMDQAAEKIGGDFFILPSSIHELLLVPDDGSKSADELRSMVQEVNATQVSPEEKLTDNVYHYDSKDHVFELAEKFEARQQEKESALDDISEEKGSVLKDLSDKKKEVEATSTKDVAKVAKSKEETR